MHWMHQFLFWTGQRPGLKSLRLIKKSSSNAAFGNLLATHPFPHEGGAQSNWDLFKRTVTSLFPRSREYLTGGYTSYDFVTVRHTCAITTALHSPTSINKRLLATSKVESLSLSNPSFWTSTKLSVGVSAGTHSPFSPKLTRIHSPPLTNALSKASVATFRSSTINFYKVLLFKKVVKECPKNTR